MKTQAKIISEIYRTFDKDWVLSYCINFWHALRNENGIDEINRKNSYKKIIRYGGWYSDSGSSRCEKSFEEHVYQLILFDKLKFEEKYESAIEKIDTSSLAILTTGANLTSTPIVKSILSQGDAIDNSLKRINSILLRQKNIGGFSHDLLNNIPYNQDTHKFWVGIYLRLILMIFTIDASKTKVIPEDDAVVEIPLWQRNRVHSIYSIFGGGNYYQISPEELDEVISPSFDSSDSLIDINSVVTSYPFVKINKNGEEIFLTSFSLIVDSLSPFMFHSLRGGYWKIFTDEFERISNKKAYDVFGTFAASLEYNENSGIGKCAGFKDPMFFNQKNTKHMNWIENQFIKSIDFPGEIDGIVFAGFSKSYFRNIFLMIECKSLQNPVELLEQVSKEVSVKSSWKSKASRKLKWVQSISNFSCSSIFVIEGVNFDTFRDFDGNFYCSKDNFVDLLNRFKKQMELGRLPEVPSSFRSSI